MDGDGEHATSLSMSQLVAPPFCSAKHRRAYGAAGHTPLRPTAPAPAGRPSDAPIHFFIGRYTVMWSSNPDDDPVYVPADERRWRQGILLPLQLHCSGRSAQVASSMATAS